MVAGDEEELEQRIESLAREKVEEHFEQPEENSISRRSFLKMTGLGLGGLALSSAVSSAWGQVQASSQGKSDVDASTLNGHAVTVGSSKPGSPATGELFFDTDTEGVHYYNGSSWVEIASGSLQSGLTGYILDDWDDNSLTSSRDSFDTTSFSGDEPSSSNSTTETRPQWTDHTGRSNLSATGQVLETDSSNSYVYSTPFNVGGSSSWNTSHTWSFHFKFVSKSSNNGSDYWGVAVNDATNYTDQNNGNNDTYFNNAYHVQINDNGSYDFRLANGGSRSGLIGGGSWSEDGNWKTGKVTRDSSGNWELFRNGSSQGTTTDTTHTDISHLGFCGDQRYVMNYDNLEVS